MKIKKERGITLIALVVTIVILLILAGVSINLVLGPNGLITKAQEAREKTKIASEDELRKLTMMEAITNIENHSYTDKNGDTATIPAGFAVSKVEGENTVNNGLVIIDANGNEFVWVPCSIDGLNNSIKYDRYVFLDSQPQDGVDLVTNSIIILRQNPISGNYYHFVEKLSNDEYLSISKYGGYYIGRYESGTETARSEISENLEPILVQANKNVYNYVSYEQCKELAENMANYYNYKNLISKICSSYAWDTALTFIDKFYNSYSNNSVQGNYGKNELMKTGKTTPVCNIYDLGGNAVEYTSENIFEDGGTTRGGSYIDLANTYPAGYRNRVGDSSGNIGRTFRITLFIK